MFFKVACDVEKHEKAWVWGSVTISSARKVQAAKNK